MLDLIGFKKEFVSQCREWLCESGPVDMKIEERKVNKAQRGELNGVLFKRDGKECAPTFYIEDFYKAYKDGTPIAALSHEAVDTAVRSSVMADILAQGSLEMLGDPDYLRVRLLNKGRNKEYLKGIPFRELGGGFVFIAEIGCGEYGAVITDALMEEYDMTADEMFDTAIKNSAERFPAVLQDLGDSVISDPEECRNLLDQASGKMPAGAGPAFVLTNSRFFWGAGALFYPGVIGRIHELLDGDFYVLPSSVHELILIAVDDQDPKQLADLVRSANRSVVKDSEILADDLFICESGQLNRVSFGGVIPACGSCVC